jgi:hypothetical protein
MPISDCEQETKMTLCSQMTRKETNKAYKKKSKTEEDMKTMKASTKVENRTIKRIRNSKSKMLVLPNLANNEEKTQKKGV